MKYSRQIVKRIRVPFLSAMIATLTAAVPAVQAYEVWLTDQSDTGKESGGFLYIYDGAQLAANPSSAKPSQTIDFSGEIGKFCEEATKKAVRRPHMLFFNAGQDHAIISFLSGQVLFMDAATKKPDACLSMGKNVHAAWPTPDQKMAIAANIAEKKFIRIWTDYAAHKFTFDPEKDVINLGAMEGGERPDTSPICPITESSSRYAFVTLRGGGLIVVDVTATPMAVVATLNNNQIHPAGCGGIQAGDTLYINSGGGWPVAPLSYDVYAIDMSNLPKSVSAKLVSQRDDRFADSHGMAAVGRYVWSADRAEDRGKPEHRHRRKGFAFVDRDEHDRVVTAGNRKLGVADRDRIHAAEHDRHGAAFGQQHAMRLVQRDDFPKAVGRCDLRRRCGGLRGHDSFPLMERRIIACHGSGSS